jgi:hypothetical protein
MMDDQRELNTSFISLSTQGNEVITGHSHRLVFESRIHTRCDFIASQYERQADLRWTVASVKGRYQKYHASVWMCSNR